MREKADLPRWPASRLGEALQLLAVRSGLPGGAGPAQGAGWGGEPPDEADAGHRVESAAAAVGFDCEQTAISYGEFEARLRHAGPALLRLPDGDFLVLLESGRLLGADLAEHRADPGCIRTALFGDAEGPRHREVARLLAEAGLRGRRRRRASAAILRDLLSNEYRSGIWLLRRSPGGDFRGQARQAGLWRSLRWLGSLHGVEYLLFLLSWWVAGKGALEGRLDKEWLLAWALLLLTLVPFRVLRTWLQGRFAITAGGLLKERLLYGALRLDQDEIRHQGVGQLLGRVIESEALESLALSAGLLGMVAVIELILAAGVVWLGAGGGLHAGVLVLWAALSVLLGRRFLDKYREWSHSRLGMTHDLVERMVGHRTRLAQQPRELWHEDEDASLERYLATSAAMDRSAALLVTLIPRGWLLVGMLALAPAFVSGEGSAAALAIGVGGNLLAFRAFKRLSAGFKYLVSAVVAWHQVAPLFRAADRRELRGSSGASLSRPKAAAGQPVLQAQGLVYRYRSRGEPVLRGCTLSIAAGDRLLLEGPSGGGKSTLASLLTGLRAPESGLLLARGLDLHALGQSGWRRVVAFAPQFHENHILTGPLVFNVLLGRQGVLTERDFREAEAVCRELGLSGLLERMPAGMLQLVGETGWQLSHGERSRVYIARALLQGAELIVLDESFGALDPENLRLAIECVVRRAPAVLAIAHQ